ncbi:MAG: hypothetical protein DCC67_02815 [Planctomycetota bacterium]|nr:MAG: hypothetical protein DCC67_02815 [Planctomycetota bacterium]
MGRSYAHARSAAEAALDGALQRTATVSWQNQELAAALARIAASGGVAVWLDRRVDPNAAVSLRADDQRLRDVLEQLAAQRQCGAQAYRGLVYVGPPQTAEELLTLSELARQSLAPLPPALRAKWLAPQRRSLPRLAEPRRILSELSTPNGAAVRGGELVPHDLWPARQTPPMAAIDLVVLVLAGFDLTCELSPDGRELFVRPIRRPVQIVREYSVGEGQRRRIESLLEEMSVSEVARRRERWTIAARAEEHEQLAVALHPPRSAPGGAPRSDRSPPRAGEQRFSLIVENQPAGKVLDQLASQLDLAIEWDPALAADARGGRDALVSCSVEQASLAELLEALLAPAGLVAERQGQRITVRRAK